ncbi:hypothetical protein [Nitrosopumilus sp.]|uniref:hypothetical protein n=1 Tax=Nitrosopumilus sp. TaxID=2024843 RepID=UPI00247D9755|nr:hypothetical protein [Nitrosopumilus sp.]MCV0411333.1 hypothetical protein [Nitrosopumilus sp.]
MKCYHQDVTQTVLEDIKSDVIQKDFETKLRKVLLLSSLILKKTDLSEKVKRNAIKILNDAKKENTLQ